MAAGLGFKTFNTGDVLTASEVNGYLMQGILVFADTAARDAAITSPQEGQFAYTKDNNSLWYYTGSAWAASGATGDIEGVTAGTGLSGGGTSGTVTLSIDTGVTADLTTAQALSAKTLIAPEERTTVSATAATGTVNFDAITQGVLYYTTNASANWTLNVRGNSGTTLNSILATGDAITVAFLVTQGSTAYYASAFQIDGSAVTPKYQGGTAFAAGNASSIDAYVYTIVKTASATFTVFASQTKFA
jgi:hypothetical protein